MNKNKLHVLGIAGSLRKNSVNKSLLREAKELAPENIEVEIYDISDIPLYNEDVRESNTPKEVIALKEKIRNSDGLLIATPEYNYSVPGVLKNTIDWLSRPLEDSPLNNEPLGIIGAGGISGTIRAQLHLRQIAVYTNMIAMNKPEMIVQRAWEKFDKDGNLLDENTKEHLKKFLIAFGEWIKRVRV